MGHQDLTINRKDNKLIYFIDSGLDKFVILMLAIIRVFIPGNLKNRFERLVDHKEILHNVFGLAFFNALGGICVMATQVKLANYLGASIYGVYSYCLAVGEIGAMIVRYGRNKTMVRDLIQFPEKRESLIVSTIFLSFINLFLFLIVTFACHRPLDIEVNWTYFLLILSPCFASLTLDPVYESIRLISWSSIYHLLQKFAFLIIIWLLFILSFKVSLFLIGFLSVITWIFIVLMEYYEVGTQLKINYFLKLNFKDLLQLYKENFVIFLSCVTGVAFGPLLRLILNNYTDSSSVGIFAAGLQIYNICLFLNTQISRVGNPMMAEIGKPDCSNKKRRKVVWNYTMIMLSTSLPFALPLLFFPSLITNTLFTEEYSSLALYLPILAIYLVAITIGVVFEQYMISMRMDKVYFVIYAFSALAIVAFAYVLIPQMGLAGAFISLCVPRSIGALFYLLFSIKSLWKTL